MIDPKKELNNEELENVNGGCGDEPDKYLPGNHGKHIGQYDAPAYVGQKVYVVFDAKPQEYYWGSLKKSEESWVIGSITERVHTVYVEGNSDKARNPQYVGNNHEFEGRNYTLFLLK